MAAGEKFDSTFTDLRGRPWLVEFDDDAIRRLSVAGLDFVAVMGLRFNDEVTHAYNRKTVVRRISVLWSLLAPQALDADITLKDFFESMSPLPETENLHAHFRAWRAVICAIVNRWPAQYVFNDATPRTDTTKA